MLAHSSKNLKNQIWKNPSHSNLSAVNFVIWLTIEWNGFSNKPLIFYPLNPTGIYMLKVNNKKTKIRCEICSKLTIKTPERSQWHRNLLNF